MKILKFKDIDDLIKNHIAGDNEMMFNLDNGVIYRSERLGIVGEEILRTYVRTGYLDSSFRYDLMFDVDSLECSVVVLKKDS